MHWRLEECPQRVPLQIFQRGCLEGTNHWCQTFQWRWWRCTFQLLTLMASVRKKNKAIEDCWRSTPVNCEGATPRRSWHQAQLNCLQKVCPVSIHVSLRHLLKDFQWTRNQTINSVEMQNSTTQRANQPQSREVESLVLNIEPDGSQPVTKTEQSQSHLALIPRSHIIRKKIYPFPVIEEASFLTGRVRGWFGQTLCASLSKCLCVEHKDEPIRWHKAHPHLSPPWLLQWSERNHLGGNKLIRARNIHSVLFRRRFPEWFWSKTK